MLGVVNVVDSDVVASDVEGSDVAGVDVAGADVEGTDVAGVDVAGADVDCKFPPEQRSSPFSLIEVKTGSCSPEKLSWNPNSAKWPSFPEK